MPERLLATSRLIGTALLDAEGEAIGSIRQVVIDRRLGQLIYVLLAATPSGGGKENGDPERLYPLLWPLLDYDDSLDGFRLRTERQRLRAGPRVDVGEPVDWNDRVWAERLHEHYGLQPYWTIGSSDSD